MKKPVWVHTAKGFTGTDADGAHVYTQVEIEIDWQRLADHLARKAIRSKSGTTKIQGGMVIGRVRRQRGGAA